METLRKRFLAVLILFTMIFTNCGYSISAIATSEDFQVIKKGLFEKDEIKLNAYFVDNDGKKSTETIGNVNEKVKMVLEVTPQEEGVLKSGLIRFVPSEEENLNFKLVGTHEDKIEEVKKALNFSTDNKEDEEQEEIVVENTVSENMPENTVETSVENTVETIIENTTEETSVENEITNTEDDKNGPVSLNKKAGQILLEELKVEEDIDEDEEEVTNTISDQDEKTETISNQVEENIDKPEEIITEEPKEETMPVEPSTVETLPEDLVDEEEIINKKLEEAKLVEELENGIAEVEIISDNEIELRYLKSEAKIEVEIEYLQGEKLTIKELMQKFKVQLSGNFINTNLDEVQIGKEIEMEIGWSYTNDIALMSEYTKVSPFEVGEVKGTIVENKITVSRMESNKYLPVKNLLVEIKAPNLGKHKPSNIEVVANKLMATKGEDVGSVVFGENNWVYDENEGVIRISVSNEEDGIAVNTVGEDEFIVTYRYDKYTEKTPELEKQVKVTLEEYNMPKNTIVEREINNTQDKIAMNIGEIVTYNAVAPEEKINKAKIYANYNSEEALYETEFTEKLSASILTSDVLETLEIKSTREVYKDLNQIEFESRDVRVKRIKFNYSEVASLLKDGGEIRIRNGIGEVIYVLTKDFITNEEDVTININNEEGIIVTFSNIDNNGTVNFEITKVILKSDYSKLAFNSFREIESVIEAEIKYVGVEESLKLENTKISKKFEESLTEATLKINKEALSTLEENKDVEIKIELNNDKETSDLYINPSFEIVFPKYVKNIRVQGLNIIYNEGLRVADFETVKDDEEILKLRIDLEGTQTKFSDSTATNGTNIILDLDIDVDDYTPAREDQIKLYYCNEGVTAYQTQTKWSITKQIPNGIIKTTNGFDVVLINYQTPTGLVIANGILNYDGLLSELVSIKQGEKSVEIPMDSDSRIATMEIIALNNTGNECTDVVILGRIPFKGNKNVLTDIDLGTTATAQMMDTIKSSVDNKNISKIYYSENEEADRRINAEENGWTETPEDLSKVKSFLIDVKGGMEAGAALLYKYDFEIPANLKYNEKLAESVGAFYYNNTENAVVYETTVADKVELATKVGARMDLNLDVDIGNETKIKSGKAMEYTITVTNSGSEPAENVVIEAPVPKYTEYVEKHEDFLGGDQAGYEPILFGNEGYRKGEIEYIYNEEKVDEENELLRKPIKIKYSVGTMEPGSTETFSYYVRTEDNPSDTRENKTIMNMVELTSSISNVDSNEIINTLEYTCFSSNLKFVGDPTLVEGMEESYTLSLKNITDKDLKNVNLVFNCGKIYEYDSAIITDSLENYENEIDDGKAANAKFDKETGKVYVNLGKIAVNEEKQVLLNLIVKQQDGEIEEDCFFEINADGIGAEYSDVIKREYVSGKVRVNDKSTIVSEDMIIATTEIINEGAGEANLLYMYVTVPAGVSIEDVFCETLGEKLDFWTDEENIYEVIIPGIDANNKLEINIKYKVQRIYETMYGQLNIERTFSAMNQEDMTLPSIKFVYDDENIRILEEDIQDLNDTTGEYNSIEDGSDKHTISGKAWIDLDRNGVLSDDEKGVSSVSVYLYKGDTMLKSTTTNTAGEYRFDDVDEGEYSVGFSYNDETYQLAPYKKTGTDEDNNSGAISVETDNMNATTDVIAIRGTTKNVNMGLQHKDKFDLAIYKYLSKVKVTTSKGEKEYTFDDVELAKIEIDPRLINGAKVELEYKVVLENIGNVSGFAEEVVDYLEEGLEFDETQNENWYMATNGNIYAKRLNDMMLEPGEKREIRLVLTKTMTDDNTGFVTNKVHLLKSFTNSNLEEESNENTSIQNTFITVATGNARYVITSIVVAFIIAGFVYMNIKGIINIDFIVKKKIYKARSKPKNPIRKTYK